MVTRAEHVEALRRERAYAATLTVEQGQVQRLADIDAELSRYDPRPEAKAAGRRPETRGA